MSDLISRQATVKAIEQHKTAVLEGHKWDEGIEYGYAAAHRHLVDIIEQLPSAQPERPTGEWIHQSKFSRIECDQCGKVFRNSFAPKNFCPNCGADMRGDKHETD